MPLLTLCMLWECFHYKRMGYLWTTRICYIFEMVDPYFVLFWLRTVVNLEILPLLNMMQCTTTRYIYTHIYIFCLTLIFRKWSIHLHRWNHYISTRQPPAGRPNDHVLWSDRWEHPSPPSWQSHASPPSVQICKTQSSFNRKLREFKLIFTKSTKVSPFRRKGRFFRENHQHSRNQHLPFLLVRSQCNPWLQSAPLFNPFI